MELYWPQQLVNRQHPKFSTCFSEHMALLIFVKGLTPNCYEIAKQAASLKVARMLAHRCVSRS